MDKLPYFEEFKVNEEELPRADQNQIMKTLVRSFDIDDLKIYLKGLMIELDITTRKKLKSYLDDGKYRLVIHHLLKLNDEPLAQLKLKKIIKIFVANPDEAGAETEADTIVPDLGLPT